MDAFVTTKAHIIGIEAKRYEPFRDQKSIALSDAYDRPVWGDRMGPFERLRDRLRGGDLYYEFLDAAQLVKHAFGLVTEAGRQGRAPVLVYLFAEPARLHGRPIPPDKIARHRAEILDFADQVSGAEVRFHSLSYRDWISGWAGVDADVARHGALLLSAFEL